jgi:hypothetical protein
LDSGELVGQLGAGRLPCFDDLRVLLYERQGLHLDNYRKLQHMRSEVGCALGAWDSQRGLITGCNGGVADDGLLYIQSGGNAEQFCFYKCDQLQLYYSERNQSLDC